MVERLQAHHLEESHGRAVELRLAWTGATPHLDDEVAQLEVAQHALAVDAANLLDSRAGHRLLVSDDRQRFVRRLREAAGNLGPAGSSPAYLLDTHPTVDAFVKNEGLGFAIPYFHNGQDHDYYPDFLIRLKCEGPCHLILEVKGYDPLAEVKRAAAERWVAAVNAEGSFGRWQYALVKDPTDTGAALASALERAPQARS